MSIKNIIKEFVPPIFFRLIKPKKREINKDDSARVFSTYNDALKLCTTDAYEEKELIEVIFKKTVRFLESMETDIIPVWETSAFSILSLINPILNKYPERINVIDFGGACGAHYFHLRKLLDRSLKLNWVVVETPTMVRFAKELETDELSFCDNFKDALKIAGNVDLLHTSGTLQCVDDAKKYLNEILECNAEWVLFNRLGLNKIDRDVITIHSSKLSWNGIGELPEGYTDRWIKYPFCFLSENTFLNSIRQKYVQFAKFNDQSGMFPIEGEDIVGYGLLCKLKSFH